MRSESEGQSSTQAKSGRNFEVEISSLHKDLLAANANWMDAEKRVAALENEVLALTDVGQRLKDQLTKVLNCVTKQLVPVLRVRACAKAFTLDDDHKRT